MTAAAAYPAELEGDLRLPNDRRIHVRPLRRGDDGPVRELYRHLSPRTRYLRFFSAAPVLSEAVLRLLTCVDYRRQLALVAELDAADGAGVVALGSYGAADDGSAEVGLVVRDEWQRQGIGTALASEVLRAAEARGFRRFVAHVAADNTGIRRLLRRVGQIVSSSTRQGVSEISFVPIVKQKEIEAGREALARGDWEAARGAFDASLRAGEQPEALEGLGLAAWWLDRSETVFDVRERAYRLYRERGDALGAARLAVWLAWDTAAFRGELSIAHGWLQLAHRLLDGRPDAVEHAWLALRNGIFALLDDGDPDAAERYASEAVRVGRGLGAVDYEMVGRALRGFARVTAGRVAEGFQELDEVNAAVLAGEMHDRVLIGLACCYLIAACERIHDYERAVQWCDRLKAFCAKWGLRPLFAVCRTQYASVCMWRGAWEEAEQELTSASEELAACRPAMTGEGLVRLGELRRRQGKLDEAMALFERGGSHPLATLGRATVTFDRGDVRTAADLAERHLRRLPAKNRTERASALELMVRACLEEHRVDDAAAAAAELQQIASEARTGPLRALAGVAAGLVAARSGDPNAARTHFEDAVDLFEESRAPFETGRARIELARVMAALGRSDAAVDEARRAIDDLTPLGASLDLDRARAILEGQVKAPSPTSATDDRQVLTPRQVEILRLIAAGLNNQAIAERLFISEHTVHRHVANTLTALDVSSRSAAVAQAVRLGLL